MSNISLNQLVAIKDHVIVQDMNFSTRILGSGIILLGDDKTTAGIRPRWARICAVGPDQKDVAVGQYVLVEHGRWTRGIEIFENTEKTTVRRIDPECILAVSDREPLDENISAAIQAQAKSI